MRKVRADSYDEMVSLLIALGLHVPGIKVDGPVQIFITPSLRDPILALGAIEFDLAKNI